MKKNNLLDLFLVPLKTLAAKLNIQIFIFITIIIILFLATLAYMKIDPILIMVLLLIFASIGMIIYYHLEKKPDKSDTEVVKVTKENPSPTMSDNELEELYLRNLREQCGYVSTAIYAPSSNTHQNKNSANTLKLDAVFTNLDVPSTQQNIQHEKGERSSRQPVLNSLSNHKKFVLLGQAGSGKSTLVNYITLCLSGEKLGETDFNTAALAKSGWKLPALMPIRVILRDYAVRGLPIKQSLWKFIEAELKRIDDSLTAYAPQLEHHLKQKGGLLLLDGYDEVPEANKRREQLKKAIQNFHAHFPKVRIVVTTRPYAYENNPAWQIPGFSYATLLNFTPDQISEYVQRWYKAVAETDPTLQTEHAATYTKQLQSEVGKNGKKGVRELAERPLLLTLICSLHRAWGGRPLPSKRHELYEASVKLLLDLWERPKMVTDEQGHEVRIGPDLGELGIDDTDKIRDALNQVAYTVHAAQLENENLKETADIPEYLLTHALIDSHPAKEIPYIRVAAYLKDRTGLIIDQGPSKNESKQIGEQPHIYTFPHRTFQEYLAACYLLAEKRPRDIAHLAREERTKWQEALLLSVGRNNSKHDVWRLVSELCPDDWENEKINLPDETRDGILLAGRALREKGLTDRVKDEEYEKIRKRVQIWHKAIVTHGILKPPNRAEAGLTLAALGDDRPGVLHCDEMRFCTVPAGEFWLEDWNKNGNSQWYKKLRQPYWLAQLPVTVAQFREFIDESGYTPRSSDSLIGADNLPVVQVNWYDSLKFCEWLDKRWGKDGYGWLPKGYHITLPSEAEWEKAARGGRYLPMQEQIIPPAALRQAAQNSLPLTAQEQLLAKRAYPWGGEPAQEKQPDETLLHHANNKTAGIGRRSSVGAFPTGRSPVGCLDMSGNIWEWTRSLYTKSFPPQLTAKFETENFGNKESLVMRGGSYYQNQNLCSARYWNYPHNYFLDYSGLRVAVSPFLPSER